MNFVNDVDFVFAGGRGEHGLITQFTDVLYHGENGSINFNDVDVIIFQLIVEVIDLVGKNTGYRSFAAASGADKKIAVRNFLISELSL